MLLTFWKKSKSIVGKCENNSKKVETGNIDLKSHIDQIASLVK
jgi:hypothetical protein